MFFYREKYQDTLESLTIYQNTLESFKFTKLPLCPKNTLHKVIIHWTLQALFTRIPFKHNFLHLTEFFQGILVLILATHLLIIIIIRSFHNYLLSTSASTFSIHLRIHGSDFCAHRFRLGWEIVTLCKIVIGVLIYAGSSMEEKIWSCPRHMNIVVA